MKNKRKLFWYLIATGVILIFLMMLLSSVLSIGDRLSKISVYLEYGFYAIALLLIFVLIIRPVGIIVFSPSFSVKTTLDNNRFRNRSIYKRVAKNVVKNGELTIEETKSIKDAKDYKELCVALNGALNGSVSKKINKIILRNAKTVMISTAISQNAKLDLYSVVAVNLRMIKEIVLSCGFRPSMKNLSKLTINVFTTALIAEGLENIAIEDVLPNSAMNTLAEIPFIKPLLSSLTQGVTNALLTLRIGIVCRKYLFTDGAEITKTKIREEALKGSIKMLPSVIADVLAIFPSKMIRLFTGRKKQQQQ